MIKCNFDLTAKMFDEFVQFCEWFERTKALETKAKAEKAKSNGKKAKKIFKILDNSPSAAIALTANPLLLMNKKL